MRFQFFLSLFILSVALVFLGCQESIDPGKPEDETDIEFLPAETVISFNTSQFQDFQVRPLPAGPISVRWIADGDSCGMGPRYRFIPDRPAEVDLQAVASIAGLTFSHGWTLQIGADLENEVTFLPDEHVVQCIPGEERELLVLRGPGFQPEITWELNGHQAEADTSFLYPALQVGIDTLRVTVSWQEQTLDHTWYIMTESPLSRLTYSPVTTEVSLIETEWGNFQVMGDLSGVSLAWRLNGELVSESPVLAYQAATNLLDVVELHLSSYGDQYIRTWNISVDPLSNHPPGPVDNLQITHGNQVGYIQVEWTAPEPGFLDIVEYRVVASYAGPLDQVVEGEVLFLGFVTSDGIMEQFSAQFGPGEGIQTDVEAWFGIQAVDSQGQLSELGAGQNFYILATWSAMGRVTNELGAPLSDIPVSVEDPLHTVFTDANGFFALGPLIPESEYDIMVGAAGPDASHYQLLIPDVEEGTSDGLHAVLLPTYGSDPSCSNFGGDYLTYFRYMTKTSGPTAMRPDCRLYHWASYPVQVFVPEFTTPEGLDFQHETVWGLDLWNQQLQETVFVQTTVPEEAQLVFSFEVDSPYANGRTMLLAPGGAPYILGDVIPEKMGVMLNTALPTAQRVRETALHELGHTLGLYRHAYCNDPGYLMYITASGILDNGPENAIHPDELRAIKAIRHLPQGFDTAQVQPLSGAR